MKRCPYCAEEIQGAAIRCRYCGFALPLEFVLGAEALPTDIEVVQSGRRYVVGVVDEAYALWDLLSPETPIDRFSGDERGLQAALEVEPADSMTCGGTRPRAYCWIWICPPASPVDWN